MIALALFLLPLFGGLITLFVKDVSRSYIICAVCTVSTLITGIIAAASYNHWGEPAFSFTHEWIYTLGIWFNLKLDGLSILLVVLCGFIAVAAVLTTAKAPRTPLFYTLLLTMQAGMIGVFLARDCFLFYVCWEAALIPIYFLCSLYGGVNKVQVSLKFFIYTLLGSLVMLTAIIFLYLQTPDRSFSLDSFYALNLDKSGQTFVFFAFYLAFAIKMPIFPFHTWQADTYTEAPVQGTMLLAGVMLKMGVYGFIRWVLPVVPLATSDYAPYVIFLCATGLVYASVIAFRQKHIKGVLAYSSLAHVALMGAAIFVADGISLQGVIIQMFSHGVNIAGLFFVAGLIEEQAGTGERRSIGGIALDAPVLATCFAILMLGSVAVPLTNGFVGEFLMLESLFSYNPYLSMVCGLTIVFSAVYMFRLYQGTMFGSRKSGVDRPDFRFADVQGADRFVLIGLSAVVLVVGICPKPFLQLTEPAVKALLLQATQFHQHL